MFFLFALLLTVLMVLRSATKSLVDPGVGVVVPGAELLILEPESDLLVGGLNGIRSVDDVSSDVNAEVSSDGTWLRVGWLGGTEHLSSGLDGVVTFPDHSDDWSRDSVLDERWEETLGGKIGVVSLELGLSWSALLHGNELESFSLKSGYNLSNESSLDTIWLDHDKGSLFFGSG
jgi:hypothetical protein